MCGAICPVQRLVRLHDGPRLRARWGQGENVGGPDSHAACSGGL